MTVNLGARSAANCTSEGYCIVGYFLNYVPIFRSPKQFKLFGRGPTTNVRNDWTMGMVISILTIDRPAVANSKHGLDHVIALVNCSSSPHSRALECEF